MLGHKTSLEHKKLTVQLQQLHLNYMGNYTVMAVLGACIVEIEEQISELDRRLSMSANTGTLT